MSSLLRQARAAVQQLADKRSPAVPQEQVDAAAALLADLWPVIARHGIKAGSDGWAIHAPRAALDMTIAARRPKRGGSKR